MSKKRINLLNQLIISICIAIISIILEVLIIALWKETNVVKDIFLTLLSTCISIAGVEIIWELVSKKSFSEFIINEIKISDNLKNSGITEFYYTYSDIQWENELYNKKSLFVFLAHGHGWLKNKKDSALKNFLHKGKLKICLANPENDKLMEAYDARFFYEPGTTKSKIKESIEILLELKQKTQKKGNIELYFINQESTTSYFYLDERQFIANLYNHSKTNTIAPAIKVNKNMFDTNKKTKFFSFLEEDIDNIYNNMEKVNDIEGTFKRL